MAYRWRKEVAGGAVTMSTAHKNESRVSARQVVRTISKHTADFIACATRFATIHDGVNVLFLVLISQFVVTVWGVLQ